MWGWSGLGWTYAIWQKVIDRKWSFPERVLTFSTSGQPLPLFGELLMIKCSSFIKQNVYICVCLMFSIQRWWWSLNWNIKHHLQSDILANMLIIIIHNIWKLQTRGLCTGTQAYVCYVLCNVGHNCLQVIPILHALYMLTI